MKSEKVYLDPKMKFDNPAEMFDYYNKNSFTINNKEIFLTRGIGLTDWEFEHKSVQVGKIIGRGQFGEVRRGKLTLKTGAVVFVAIKSIIEGKLCEFPSDAPGDLVKYVKEKMWNKNPEQREQMDKVHILACFA
ncbi:unnamed protein product [Haemonchus placei]|uniref:Protein kinase domain-containing protein n=1 Tax=Haemonchus placei TaxID=6290 RepID=A0A3P7Y4H0_HAEPC|nr:unnamed protein product [Haemonchus placei]